MDGVNHHTIITNIWVQNVRINIDAGISCNAIDTCLMRRAKEEDNEMYSIEIW